MIICSHHNLVFIHIPKAGGSTIRHALREKSTQSLSNKIVEVKGYGPVDIGHIPLSLMRVEFSDLFETVCRSHSFALIREPRHRLMSSVYQYFRRQLGTNSIPVSARLFRQHLPGLQAQLVRAVNTGVWPAPIIHFCPQSSFIYLDGERVVGDLFDIKDTTGLSRFLQERLAISPSLDEKDALQRSSFAPSWTRALIGNSTIKGAVRCLPSSVRTRLKARMQAQYDGKALIESLIMENNDMKALFDHAYEFDNRIYNQAVR